MPLQSCLAPEDISFDAKIYKIGENKYGNYCVPISSQHRPAADCILNGEVYEEQTLDFMRRCAGDGDIIHAGTYFGDFLPALSRGVRSGRLIWAFEPNPENYAAAVITCRLNDLQNVKLFNSGLGESAAIMKMRVRSAGKSLGGASSIIGDPSLVPTQDIIDVPIRRIDDVVPRSRKISLLQLDVEGFEQFAIAGAVETIATWRPILILETLPVGWPGQGLSPSPYKIRGQLHENTVLSTTRVRLGSRSSLRRLAAKASFPVRRLVAKARNQ
jgi:FkbM family methyltransferase